VKSEMYKTEPGQGGGAARALIDPSTLGTIFAATAEAHASRPAMTQYQQVATYQELLAEVDALAAGVTSRCLSADAPVAVIVRSWPTYVVAIVGIVRAGLPYMPLYPGWPKDYLTQLLAAGQPQLIVCDEKTIDSTRALECGVPVIGAADLKHPVDLRHSLPRRVASSRQLAYVMCTSGTSGSPKAVGIEHRSVINLVKNTQRYAANADDRVACHSSVAFDASTFEIWTALLSGSCLVLPDTDIGEMIDYLALLRGSSVAWLTAPLLQQLADIPAIRLAIAALRVLITGGAVVDPGSIDRLTVPEVALNGYGPTETTTFASVGSLRARTPRGSVPIGEAIDGVHFHILGPSLREVADGVAGELCIGGMGVARGYLHDPRTTADRYLPDFCTPGARMYATGDLVQRTKGNLDFLGRQDAQMKIRGHRLDPEQVERALRTISEVGMCWVGQFMDDKGGAHLVAAVQALHPNVTAARVLAFARQALPAFAVPTRLLVLPALPLTIAGKVDIEAVIRLVHADDRAGVSVAARGPVAAAIADCWERVLGTAFSNDADFFELGGSSLDAIRLIAILQRELNVVIEPVDLFRAPRFSEFAEFIERRLAKR
jgi:amino acid adenylation domain-containing protein